KGLDGIENSIHSSFTRPKLRLNNSLSCMGRSPTYLSSWKTPIEVIFGLQYKTSRMGKIGSRPTSPKKRMNLCKVILGKCFLLVLLYSITSCKYWPIFMEMSCSFIFNTSSAVVLLNAKYIVTG